MLPVQITMSLLRTVFCLILKVRKKGKEQESIQSSTTFDPEYQWERNNFTTRHNKREPKGQPFPSR